ncbi:uncharacterized protein LOC110942772 [Helianthus annuus]|uniref:uncharacterized protein LOC110942772 n=1 Tax=Helianthus annuus TaxID=4232 RepID=UPI0016531191|nr:uncharacterized protein LOC110942772 [Helianthus annuus]
MVDGHDLLHCLWVTVRTVMVAVDEVEDDGGGGWLQGCWAEEEVSVKQNEFIRYKSEDKRDIEEENVVNQKNNKTKKVRFSLPGDEFVSSETKELVVSNESDSSKSDKPHSGNESGSSKQEEPSVEVKEYDYLERLNSGCGWCRGSIYEQDDKKVWIIRLKDFLCKKNETLDELESRFNYLLDKLKTFDIRLSDAEKISKFADALPAEWNDILKNIKTDSGFSKFHSYEFIKKLKTHSYENYKKKKDLMDEIKKNLYEMSLDVIIEINDRIRVHSRKSQFKKNQVLNLCVLNNVQSSKMNSSDTNLRTNGILKKENVVNQKNNKTKKVRFSLPGDEFVSSETKELVVSNESDSSKSDKPHSGNESGSSKQEEPSVEVKGDNSVKTMDDATQMSQCGWCRGSIYEQDDKKVWIIRLKDFLCKKNETLDELESRFNYLLDKLKTFDIRLSDAEKISKFADALPAEWNDILKNIKTDSGFSKFHSYEFIKKLKTHSYENYKKKKDLMDEIKKNLDEMSLDVIIEINDRIRVHSRKSQFKKNQVLNLCVLNNVQSSKMNSSDTNLRTNGILKKENVVNQKNNKTKKVRFSLPGDEFVSSETKELVVSNESDSSKSDKPHSGNESGSSKQEEPSVEVKGDNSVKTMDDAKYDYLERLNSGYGWCRGSIYEQDDKKVWIIRLKDFLCKKNETLDELESRFNYLLDKLKTFDIRLSDAEKISKFADALPAEWNDILKNIKTDSGFSKFHSYEFIKKLKTHSCENYKKKKDLMDEIKKNLDEMSLDVIIEINDRIRVHSRKSQFKKNQVLNLCVLNNVQSSKMNSSDTNLRTNGILKKENMVNQKNNKTKKVRFSLPGDEFVSSETKELVVSNESDSSKSDKPHSGNESGSSKQEEPSVEVKGDNSVKTMDNASFPSLSNGKLKQKVEMKPSDAHSKTPKNVQSSKMNSSDTNLRTNGILKKENVVNQKNNKTKKVRFSLPGDEFVSPETKELVVSNESDSSKSDKPHSGNESGSSKQEEPSVEVKGDNSVKTMDDQSSYMAGSDEVNNHLRENNDITRVNIAGAELQALIDNAVTRALDRQYNESSGTRTKTQSVPHTNPPSQTHVSHKDDSHHSSNQRSVPYKQVMLNQEPRVKTCSYKYFVSCKPRDFIGEKGAINCMTWLDEMDTVVDISGWVEQDIVKNKVAKASDDGKRKREDENSHRSDKKKKGNSDHKKSSEFKKDNQQSGEKTTVGKAVRKVVKKFKEPNATCSKSQLKPHFLTHEKDLVYASDANNELKRKREKDNSHTSKKKGKLELKEDKQKSNKKPVCKTYKKCHLGKCMFESKSQSQPRACGICKSSEHKTLDCKDIKDAVCFGCNEKGHIKTTCPKSVKGGTAKDRKPKNESV